MFTPWMLAGLLLLAGWFETEPTIPPTPPVPAKPGISMDPSLWDTDWSVGTPPHPTPYSNGSWLRRRAGGVRRRHRADVQEPALVPARQHNRREPGRDASGALAVDVEVEPTPAPTYNFALDPTPPCAGDKALVSLYFQRRGDDYYAEGDLQYYRWWSKQVIYLDGLTSAKLSVSLEIANWQSVYVSGDKAPPAMFAAAMADPIAVGLAFGGLCGSHHGLNVSGGTSRITVLSYRMQ